MIEQASDGYPSQPTAPQRADLSFSSEISTAALVRLLVRKGIVAPAELLEEERRTRLVLTATSEDSATHTHPSKSRLKRWAAKRRWTRRLTHRLFGWEFKRIRHEKKEETPAE